MSASAILGGGWSLYIIASVVTGTVIWRMRLDKEGTDNENDVGDDPMKLSFNKRFKRSQEGECCRTVTRVIYDYTRKGIFNFFSLLLGIIFSVIWGFLMGYNEFALVWYILPGLEFGKRLYLPASKIVGILMNAIFGQCLRNLKTQPASFNFNNLNGNNNVIYNKKNEDDNDDIVEKDKDSKDGDQFGLNFITIFPKSDEIEGIRKVEKICYQICRIGSYNVQVAIIGIPLSLIWGILFGIFQFFFIWIYSPMLRIYSMFATPFARVSGLIQNAIFGKCIRNVRSEPYSFNWGNGPQIVVQNNNNNGNNDATTTVGANVPSAPVSPVAQDGYPQVGIPMQTGVVHQYQ